MGRRGAMQAAAASAAGPRKARAVPVDKRDRVEFAHERAAVDVPRADASLDPDAVEARRRRPQVRRRLGPACGDARDHRDHDAPMDDGGEALRAVLERREEPAEWRVQDVGHADGTVDRPLDRSRGPGSTGQVPGGVLDLLERSATPPRFGMPPAMAATSAARGSGRGSGRPAGSGRSACPPGAGGQAVEAPGGIARDGRGPILRRRDGQDDRRARSGERAEAEDAKRPRGFEPVDHRGGGIDPRVAVVDGVSGPDRFADPPVRASTFGRSTKGPDSPLRHLHQGGRRLQRLTDPNPRGERLHERERRQDVAASAEPRSP